jgi:hypothetical protein
MKKQFTSQRTTSVQSSYPNAPLGQAKILRLAYHEKVSSAKPSQGNDGQGNIPEKLPAIPLTNIPLTSCPVFFFSEDPFAGGSAALRLCVFAFKSPSHLSFVAVNQYLRPIQHATYCTASLYRNAVAIPPLRSLRSLAAIHSLDSMNRIYRIQMLPSGAGGIPLILSKLLRSALIPFCPQPGL